MDWPFSKTSDEQLMWRVRHHRDESAFVSLMERWQPAIHRLSSRMLQDPVRGEDITQDVFARVYLNRGHFDPQRKFSTWIWQIALNRCRDEIRRQQRHPESELAATPHDPESEDALGGIRSTEPTPHEAAVRSEEGLGVRRALDALPEMYREVVILRHYENLKFAEIAGILDIPEGTVKSRMAEGLGRLAGMLEIHAPRESTAPLPTITPTITPADTQFRLDNA